MSVYSSPTLVVGPSDENYPIISPYNTNIMLLCDIVYPRITLGQGKRLGVFEKGTTTSLGLLMITPAYPSGSLPSKKMTDAADKLRSVDLKIFNG